MHAIPFLYVVPGRGWDPEKSQEQNRSPSGKEFGSVFRGLEGEDVGLHAPSVAPEHGDVSPGLEVRSSFRRLRGFRVCLEID